MNRGLAQGRVSGVGHCLVLTSWQLHGNRGSVLKCCVSTKSRLPKRKPNLESNIAEDLSLSYPRPASLAEGTRLYTYRRHSESQQCSAKRKSQLEVQTKKSYQGGETLCDQSPLGVLRSVLERKDNFFLRQRPCGKLVHRKGGGEENKIFTASAANRHNNMAPSKQGRKRSITLPTAALLCT